jgi:methyl-accepting chemotaxis protein
MEKATILKIFLASPGDVKPERELIFALKDDLDHLIGKPNSIRFEFVNWERNAYPGIGEDAQDVINQNINDDYSIFIGIFWQRFGTPTNRAESGTKEEYDRAYKKFNSNSDSNHIMLYFKTAPPDNIYDLDYIQFEKVKNFKKEIQNQGVLYWEFTKTDELKNLLFLHLSSLVKDKFSNNDTVSNLPAKSANKESMDKYELLAQEVDKGDQSVSVEGIFDLLEQTTDSMNRLPIISENITGALEFIGTKFTDKAKQINVVSSIKDDRLRLKKATQIINSLSIDLNKYSDDLNDLLPDFRFNLNTAIESYTKLLLTASESSIFIEEVQEQMKTSVPELSNSMENALVGIAELLQAMSDLPSMTSKFGNSKRRAELSTNELFKEFISAKKLVKQLMN